MQANSESSLDKATQVCRSCKDRKRRCNKALPKCSSCVRRDVTCEYTKPQAKNDPVLVASECWYNSMNEDRNIRPIDFPTMLFLDPSILQHGQVEMTHATARVPQHILHLLGDIDDIRLTADNFLSKVHPWMPFISKKRFYEIYLQPSFQSRPEVVLLFLSLKLITTLPSANPRTPLYYATKHFYLEVESLGVLSILILQAGVLLALYEIGHGIYPTAFLSIGACSRYSYALGINSKRTNTRRILTLVEVEERRRVWWAIVILDRFVSIGCPERPLAAPDPGLDDLLPTDDAAWDQGIVRTSDSFPLSSPMTAHMSKFALLCQAARLLGQVLQHVSRRNTDSSMHDDDRIQLDRTLQSMLTASLDVAFPDYDQITFIYSTLVALYAPFSSPSTARSQRSTDILHQISNRIRENLVERECFLGRDPESISPWGLFFAYHVCGAHMRSPETNSAELVQTLKEALVLIDVRWKLAGIYLQLLEAQEIINHC